MRARGLLASIVIGCIGLAGLPSTQAVAQGFDVGGFAGGLLGGAIAGAAARNAYRQPYYGGYRRQYRSYRTYGSRHVTRRYAPGSGGAPGSAAVVNPDADPFAAKASAGSLTPATKP